MNNSEKITDFGISTQLGHLSDVDNTSSGTLAYMAPERLENSIATHPKSDIWSFGATLFELITGEVPYGEDGRTPIHADLKQFLTDRGVLPKIQKLILECFNTDFENRPSAKDIVELCRHRRYGSRINWKRLALVSIVLAGLAIGGNFWWSHNKKNDLRDHLIGTWIFDNPEGLVWEQQELFADARLFYSAFNRPHVWVNHFPGTFWVGNNTINLFYETMTHHRIESYVRFKTIRKNEHEVEFFTQPDNISVGVYSYHRLIDTVRVNVGKSVRVTCDRTANLTINDTTIARIDKENHGVIGKRPGLTYLSVETPEDGAAYIEIKVCASDWLLPDFGDAIGLDFDKTSQLYGKYFIIPKQHPQDAWYIVRENDLIDYVTLVGANDSLHYVDPSCKQAVTFSPGKNMIEFAPMK